MIDKFPAYGGHYVLELLLRSSEPPAYGRLRHPELLRHVRDGELRIVIHHEEVSGLSFEPLQALRQQLALLCFPPLPCGVQKIHFWRDRRGWMHGRNDFVAV